MKGNNLIKVKGAREQNLKDIDVDIPTNSLVVITGISGSGKSSLAFDTIYAEGQRRYVESLSAYARQFLQLQNKPNVTSITGLSPAISIDQKTTSKNPRSTVGTVTEINDYLRLLFARIGVPFSPATNLPIKSQTISEMVDIILSLKQKNKVLVTAPETQSQKGEFKKKLITIKRQGFTKVIIDGITHDLDNDDLPVLKKTQRHDISVIIDEIVISKDEKQRIVEALESALKIANGICEIYEIKSNEPYEKDFSINSKKKIVFSERHSCPISGFQISDLEPRLFSFNNAFGACQSCHGLGFASFFSPMLIAPNHSISTSEIIAKCFSNLGTRFYHISNNLKKLAVQYDFSIDSPISSLSEETKNIFFFGNKSGKIKEDGVNLQENEKSFFGIIPYFLELSSNFSKGREEQEIDYFSKYKDKKTCESCNGYRLKKESLCVKIAGLNIGEVTNMDVESMHSWFTNLHKNLEKKELKIANQIIKEIKERLGFLLKVGVGYLTLSRYTMTLSGGESQRIRLASQIGSGLCGVLYVLDEPSIGLHQRDNERLIETLIHLKNLGNTVIVVEHDSDTMLAADHIIDMGPGAGEDGGRVVAEGNIDQIIQNKNSLTGKYLSKEKEIAKLVKKTEVPQNWLELEGATSNNLKNVTLRIPIGFLSVISGVSGSGKSTLLLETLYPAVQSYIDPSIKIKKGKFSKLKGVEFFSKVINVDQSPIGKTPRSTPSTYIGLFSLIRDLFASMPESKVRGYKIGRFSFNVKGGRCETCKGDGIIKIEMHFLHDIYVECESCQGKRYNRETLEIKYKGKSISQILNMTVKDCMKFFEKVPVIFDKISVLDKVGLGYLKLGQSSTTLSGGESQRVKLAKELVKYSRGKTLYIFDEPTTGLHFEDIDKLMKILFNLVEMGNTVIVIEHNIDVIQRADYVVDMGPEGGAKGGKIVACGSVDFIAKCNDSITGKFLKRAN